MAASCTLSSAHRDRDRLMPMPPRQPRLQAPFAVREEMVAVCRALSERQLIAGQDGNVSVRIAADRVLVTPAGFAKGLRPFTSIDR